MRVLPSQVVQAIELLIGRAPTDIFDRRIRVNHNPEIKSILALLGRVPSELITLTPEQYIELTRCQAVLTTACIHWDQGGVMFARDVGGKDPVERIRLLMSLCSDQLPPTEPELPFIHDEDTRVGIERQLHAAWTNFTNQEWLGAVTFAGAAMEALLLWALIHSGQNEAGEKQRHPNELHLPQLITRASEAGLVGSETEQIARHAKDARNLIHPGKVARSGQSCTKASALIALAGIYRIVEDLKMKKFGAPA